jgi:uncharacterized membrane protein YoaK (UPF0700 family)
MLSKPIPRWVLGFGFLLTILAGWVNVVGILGFDQAPVSHMSGNLALVGLGMGLQQWPLLYRAGGVVAAFFGGAMISGYVIRNEALTLGRHYSWILFLETAAIAGAIAFGRRHSEIGELLLALGCGLQNGMVSSYSGSVIRTTHMTGMVTDVGIALGQWLRRQAIDRRRLGLYSLLLTGFVCGSVAGAAAYGACGNAALWAPAAAAFATAICAFIAHR